MRQASLRALAVGLLLVLSAFLDGCSGGTARTILARHDDGTPASPFHGRYVLVHADGYPLDQHLTMMYALKARTWRRAILERLERDVAALGQRSDCQTKLGAPPTLRVLGFVHGGLNSYRCGEAGGVSHRHSTPRFWGFIAPAGADRHPAERVRLPDPRQLELGGVQFTL